MSADSCNDSACKKSIRWNALFHMRRDARDMSTLCGYAIIRLWRIASSEHIARMKILLARLPFIG
jgi:hypothetical protein